VITLTKEDILKKVLIVDDFAYNLEFEEKLILSIMKEYRIKIHIDTALNVYEAVKKIKEKRGYDVLIVDMNLPDGSGSEVAKEALAQKKQTKIAALTLYPESYQQHQELFDLVIRKPVMPARYKEDFKYLLGLDSV